MKKEDLDFIDDFYNGFARIQKNNKWNWIDTKGNILYKTDSPKEWFDNVDYFYEGFAQIKKNNKWNWVDTKGNILYKPNNPDEWFDNVNYFYDGFTVIKKNNKWNWVDTKGNILYKPNNPDEWFDYVYYFHDGFADCKKDGITYYIDTKCNLYDENKNLIVSTEAINKLKNIILEQAMDIIYIVERMGIIKKGKIKSTEELSLGETFILYLLNHGYIQPNDNIINNAQFIINNNILYKFVKKNNINNINLDEILKNISEIDISKLRNLSEK